jgi:hypothetical protein
MSNLELAFNAEWGAIVSVATHLASTVTRSGGLGRGDGRPLCKRV